MFGADMAVELVNDGPTTILLESHRLSRRPMWPICPISLVSGLLAK